MPIIGIQGDIGMGKTLAMTWFLLQEHLRERRKLYANYTLLQLPFTKITVSDLVQSAARGEGFTRAAVGIDEVQTWLDARASSTKINRIISYFINQTGKEDVNLYYTTQDLEMVERRLRRRTDVAFHVIRRGDRIILYGTDKHADAVTTQALWGPTVYDFYRTRERVPLPTQMLAAADKITQEGQDA